MTPSTRASALVLGPPGSGKSTIAARLADRLDARPIDVGELLRAAAAEDSPRGRALRAAMSAGALVPDAEADRAVRERLARLPRDAGFVLVGYPRTPGQAKRLRDTLAELGRLDPPPPAFRLDVERDELLRRLDRRGETERRSDDAVATRERRLAGDAAREPAVLDALRRWTDVVDVDAGDSPAAITDRIAGELARRQTPDG